MSLSSVDFSSGVRSSGLVYDAQQGRSQILLELLSHISSSKDPQTKLLEQFVELMLDSELPGPLPSLTKGDMLGQGSQFRVHKAETFQYKESWHAVGVGVVAVKEPICSLRSDNMLILADPNYRRQIHDMYLEMFALTRESLRSHPNVISLLAWGRDTVTWQKPFMLVMEFASQNLQELMETLGSTIDFEQKWQLCCHVGAGLDAIHDCGLAHGDLKPQNILICTEETGFRAKIADFGFCIDETDLEISQVIIGTPGWQAPEIEKNTFQVAQIDMADNFSYGLVIWSVMLLLGRCPPRSLFKSRSDAAIENYHQGCFEVSNALQEMLLQALRGLLQEDVSKRLSQISHLVASGQMAHMERYTIPCLPPSKPENNA